MHPVSKDRVEWVTARLKLVEAMFAELRDRPAKYIPDQGAWPQGYMNQALVNIAGEALQLRVELEVLRNLYESGEEEVR